MKRLVMKVGDLVDDIRCKSGTKWGKAGLVLYVDQHDSTVRIRWPISPHLPLWVPMEYLRPSRIASRSYPVAYSADPM